MRKAHIFYNKKLAGTLVERSRNSYLFIYDNNYFDDANTRPISLTLSKNKKEYYSSYLFPFFYNMLSEGANKKLQSRHLQIDENDYFGLLVATAQYDTIGPISIKKIADG